MKPKKSLLLVELADKLGGFSALGREFKTSGWAIQKWALQNKVPAERVPHLLDLAALHGIDAKPWQIRPDVYPMSLFTRFR
jgi:hypothetical protein